VVKGPVGCIRGCLLVVAVLLALVAVMNYLVTIGDPNGMKTVLVAGAVLVVVAIAFFGHSSHWTS
jgi:hypothetical protein